MIHLASKSHHRLGAESSWTFSWLHSGNIYKQQPCLELTVIQVDLFGAVQPQASCKTHLCDTLKPAFFLKDYAESFAWQLLVQTVPLLRPAWQECALFCQCVVCMGIQLTDLQVSIILPALLISMAQCDLTVFAGFKNERKPRPLLIMAINGEFFILSSPSYFLHRTSSPLLLFLRCSHCCH